jgi:hypothetical protein
MSNSITDWKFCQQGSHQVHRDEMVTLRCGNVWRHLCQSCKDKLMLERKKIKEAR